MVILTQMDVFSIFCKILLSRIRFEISGVCNAVQDIPRTTENKMFRNLKRGGEEDSEVSNRPFMLNGPLIIRC